MFCYRLAGGQQCSNENWFPPSFGFLHTSVHNETKMATQLFAPVIPTGPDTPPGREAPPTPSTYKKKLHLLLLCVRWPSYFLVGWKWKIQHPQPGLWVFVQSALQTEAFNSINSCRKKKNEKNRGLGKRRDCIPLTAKLAFANWKPWLSAYHGQMGATYCDWIH